MRRALSWLTALACAGGLQAADISWGTPTTISGDSDVATGGDLAWAYHFTFNSTASTTVNGVTFDGVPYNATGINVSFNNPGALYGQNTVFEGPTTPFTSLSSSYQSVISGAAYWTNSSGTVTLTSLTPGLTYQVQIWVNDSRAGSTSDTIGRTDLINDGNGNQITLAYNDGVTTSGGSLGQYVIGSFVASGPTQAINVLPGPGGDAITAQVNAMTLRSVPEPSTWALLIGGGIFVLWSLRRKLAK